MKSIATVVAVIALLIGAAIGYGASLAFSNSGAGATSTSTVTSTVTGSGSIVTTTATVGAGATATITSTTTSTLTSTVSGTGTGTGSGGLSGTIPIGVIAPITYGAWSEGALTAKAAQLAAQDVNTWLANISAPWRIQLIVEDSQGSSNTALQNLQTLASQGVQVVAGPPFSSDAAALLSYADTHQIVLISGSTAENLVNKTQPNYLFRTLPINTVELKGQVAMWRAAGYKGVVVTNVNCCACPNDYSVLQGLTSTAGISTQSITYDQNTKDYSAQVAQLNQYVTAYNQKYGAGHVAVYSCGFDEELTMMNLAQQYPALVGIPWFGGDGTVSDPKVSAYEPVVASEFYTCTTIGPTASAKYAATAARIEKVTGPGFGIYTVEKYDDVWLAALSIMAAGTNSGPAIAAALPHVADEYFGATGWMHLNQYGDRAFATIDLYRVVPLVNGTAVWALVGTYDPSGDVLTWSQGFGAHSNPANFTS